MTEQHTEEEPERLSANALTETLNGFDEIAIRNAFGQNLSKIREDGDQLLFIRALIYIDKRRARMTDAQAYQAAMNVRTVDLDGYFPDDPEEIDPEQPVTAEGKDDTPPE